MLLVSSMLGVANAPSTIIYVQALRVLLVMYIFKTASHEYSNANNNSSQQSSGKAQLKSDVDEPDAVNLLPNAQVV